MKLRIVWFLLFLFVAVQTLELPINVPKYLHYMGSFKTNITNEGKTLVKRYYVSSIPLYWNEAIIHCRVYGMHILSVDSKEELIHFQILMAMQSNKYKTNFERKELSVSPAKRKSIEGTKFVCETSEYVENYEEELDIKDSLNNTSFKHLLTYNGKEYYYTYLRSIDIRKGDLYCRAFGMILASPRSTKEINILKNKTKAVDIQLERGYVQFAIGLQYSKLKSSWLINGREPPFSVSSTHGDDEKCGAVSKYGADEGLCHKLNYILCENDTSKNFQNIFPNKGDMSYYLQPLVIKETSDDTATNLYVSVRRSEWLDAVLTCKLYGMEIYSPKTAGEFELLKTVLSEAQKIPNDFYLGAMSNGRDYWYTVNGKILFADVDVESNRCLSLIRDDSTFRFRYISSYCNEDRFFICQNNIQPISINQ